ncbi:unnamed protein product, partial [Rotaria sp. Silwood2]
MQQVSTRDDETFEQCIPIDNMLLAED